MPATDEIYEKYLQKAIVEINDLAHEVAADGRRARARRRLRPSARRRDAAEVQAAAGRGQEGVAFYGRAGQAILKSLQRLHVDPMSVYGTNCVKFADGDEEESRPFLTRELHIVQPKLIVAMGENTVEYPQLDRVSARRYRGVQAGQSSSASRATVQVLVVPDIDASLDEAPAKTQFWNAFKPLGQWWAELPPY